MKKKRKLWYFSRGSLSKILLKMKLMTFLVLLGLVGSAADSYSQAAKFNLKMHNATVLEVFQQIEENSEFILLYNEKWVDVNRRVDVQVKNETVKEVLDQTFKGTQNVYKIYDRQIVVLKDDKTEVPVDVRNQINESRNLNSGAAQQQKAVAGVITDESGHPLPGVTVLEKGTTNGTVTNTDGEYSLNISASSDTLQFSFIGMQTMIVPVDDRTVINIVMQQETEGLEEVVVIGYGTQRKGSVIGSVDRIETQQLKQPTRTISTSLAGRLAGVVSVQGSGEPGYDGADFWIRGVNTFTGNTSPLILVDGVERDLDNVDPEEITDFTILKDATATAVYGVRGANGVVLITTKKGSIGEPDINLRMENSFSDPLELPDFVDGTTYMTMQNEALGNNGKNPLYSQETIQRTESGFDPNYYPDVNWLDELIDHWTPTQRVTLNVSGGSEKVRYFVSGAFLNQSGMWKSFGGTSYNNNVNVKRYNFRANVDMNITSTTILGVNLAAILEDRNYPGESSGTIFSWVLQTPPTWFPMTYPDESKVPGYPYGMARNPYQLLARSGFSTENHSTVQSNFNISQELDFITEGLSARGLFAFDSYTRANITRSMQPRPYLIIPYGFDEEGNPILQNEEGEYNYQDQEPNSTSYHNYLTRDVEAPYTDRSLYIEATLNYNRRFGQHDVGGLLLYNQSDKTFPSLGGIYESVPQRHQGLTGRVNYAFNQKYFGEFNFGYNGSENFAPGKRYGFFPSAAVGWVPTEESFTDFMKPVIDYMKIRLSHGYVGNDGLNSRFVYLTRVEGTSTNVGFGTNNGYGYGAGSGINITYYGNPDATWERAAKTDLGLEVHFLDNFVLQADGFYEKRDNIWVQLSRVPDIFGFSTKPYANAGEMENMGVDAFLEYSKPINDDLSINFKGTFTFSQNNILANGEEKKKYEYQSAIGQPFGREMGYIAEGLFVDQAEINNSPSQVSIGGESKPGDIKYKDVNDDGIVDQFDRVYMGHPTIPEMTYGFGSNIFFKDFDFSLLFQGAARVSFFANPKAFPEEDRGNVLTVIADSYWSEETQDLDAEFPRLGIGQQTKNYTNSSWWLRNGSYLRLKQIELGYSLPKLALGKYNIDNARIYVNGLNLFTYSPFKWWDPESKSSTGMYYPIQKVINAGVEIKF
ncbi:TonB-linked outer membrane protein, SusC/RagA family [Tangfeifania diversioriginum]|uniref:TonB-linked outer membrane protein, SusC/RagA family n=1 Tax=Tangfeifania diversioriginum TaxID=1168035 RepID=A0A1M6J8C2_9BACT|nr:TonB-dependent receptor [Tangfeifania diversioriginum]SHJ42973.1 TonB-linked outer membrane protein, SusC/RagA family [Tangfeifania diversioriginum]